MWINNGKIIDGTNNGGSAGQVLGVTATENEYQNVNITGSITSGGLISLTPTVSSAAVTALTLQVPDPEQHTGRTVTDTYTLSSADILYDLLTFNTITFEENDVDVNTSLERITVNSTGKYLVTIKGQIFNSAGSQNRTYIRLKKSGTSQTEYEGMTQMTTDEDYPFNYSDVISLTSGQYIEIEARRGNSAKQSFIRELYVTVSKL